MSTSHDDEGGEGGEERRGEVVVATGGGVRFILQLYTQVPAIYIVVSQYHLMKLPRKIMRFFSDLKDSFEWLTYI